MHTHHGRRGSRKHVISRLSHLLDCYEHQPAPPGAWGTWFGVASLSRELSTAARQAGHSDDADTLYALARRADRTGRVIHVKERSPKPIDPLGILGRLRVPQDC